MYRVCAAAIATTLSIRSAPVLSAPFSLVLVEVKSGLHSLDREKQFFIIRPSKQSPRTKGDFFAQSNTDSEPSEISPQPTQPNPSNSLNLCLSPSLFLLVTSSLLGASLLLLLSSIKIIGEENEAIVERVGRYNRKLTPGINLVLPFLEMIVVEDTTRERILKIDPQNVLSGDGIPITIEVIPYWKIIDLERVFYNTLDIEKAIIDLSIAASQSLLVSLDAEDELVSYKEIEQSFIEMIDESTEILGVKVTRCEVKNVTDSHSFTEALEMRADNQVLRSVDGNTFSVAAKNGVNLQAFQESWKKLEAENEGVDMKIVDTDYRNDGLFVFKIKVPSGSDVLKLHRDFTRKHFNAIDELYRAASKGKDELIEFYKQNSPTYNIDIIDNTTRQENTIMINENDQSRKTEIGTVSGDLTASGAAFNLGEISDTVANTINQLSEGSQPEQPSVEQILQQLYQLFDEENNLTGEDKAEALEQLKILAEASQNPTEGTMRKAAKTAMKVLRGTIAALPPTVALVKVCNELLPKLVEFLGL